MRPLRAAFVTAEFPSEPGGGGLSTYLGRMTRALRDAGCEPEVFVLSRAAPGIVEWHGVRVERVPRVETSRPARAALRACRALGRRAWQTPVALGWHARSLARALGRREARAPFDFVQSADYQSTGLCVPRSPRRPHLVRISSSAALWARADGDDSPRSRWLHRCQLAQLRRADRLYAPSRFLAEHFERHHGLSVEVLRPPVFRDASPAASAPAGLPKRYLLHFGGLCGVKGSPVLARALPLAWEREPELAMVWAGADRQRRMPEWRALWGPHRHQIVWLDALEKPELYALLRDAEASVLPSRVDNLPNAALESLLFGIPVIASRGASLDELVEEGRSGALVPIGDASALAEAMVRAWRGEGAVRRGFEWRSEIAAAMRPERAVEGLLRLAGLGRERAG